MLEHPRAEAAGQHVLLDRHQQLVLGGELLDQLAVERLREAAVGDGRLEALVAQDLRGAQRDLDAVAVAEQRDALAGQQQLALADLDLLRARPASARPRRRRAGSGRRSGRRRRRGRCAACGRASPRRAAPSRPRSAARGSRRRRRRRGGWGRRRRPGRRGPSRRRRSASAGRRRGRAGRRRAAGRSSRSRRPASLPGSRGRRRTGPRPARRCRRRSTARAAPSWSLSRPVPPAIAAVIPITRWSRLGLLDQGVGEHRRVLGRRLGRRLLELLDLLGRVGSR